MDDINIDELLNSMEGFESPPEPVNSGGNKKQSKKEKKPKPKKSKPKKQSNTSNTIQGSVQGGSTQGQEGNNVNTQNGSSQNFDGNSNAGSVNASNDTGGIVNQQNSRVDSDDIERKVSPGRVVGCVFLGLLMSFIFFITVGSLYTRYITYPAQEEVIYELTGAYALANYEEAIHSQKSVAGENYLLKEIDYANADKSKLKFINKVVNTVDYEPIIINAKNVYGNIMINQETKETVTVPSPSNAGEEVDFSYIDYENLNFDVRFLAKKLLEYDLYTDNVNYSTVLVDVFCDCVTETDDLPIRTEKRVPEMKGSPENGYEVTGDEDVYLDELLFSSKEFSDCQLRFSELVGYLLTGSELQPTKEWLEWNSLNFVKKESTPEPYKYGKLSILRNWCGSYYLQNDNYSVDELGNKISEVIKPQLGDGTLESPASIGTPLVSYVLKETDKGTLKEMPIKVELTEFGVSEDALTWFQSKHIQNRGYNLESEVQYYYAVFKVTNLSNEELVIKDNSSLCDKNVNLSSRTGTVFGLSEEIVLKPDEEGIIETWGRSTELYRKYLIWGADFEKRIQPVWFRVLAGDLEDNTLEKGVYIINRARSGMDTDSDEEDENSGN